MGNLRFMSTASMERSLDGSDERFHRFFFAIYHCSPDEKAWINDRREELRQQHPDKAVNVGKYFILTGESAYQALGGYYHAMTLAETLPDETRQYYKEQLDKITKLHRDGKSLPVPVDLTEGQMAQDFRLEFLTCIALRNGQVDIAQS